VPQNHLVSERRRGAAASLCGLAFPAGSATGFSVRSRDRAGRCPVTSIAMFWIDAHRSREHGALHGAGPRPVQGLLEGLGGGLLVAFLPQPSPIFPTLPLQLEVGPQNQRGPMVPRALKMQHRRPDSPLKAGELHFYVSLLPTS
jgi:hypothetical protein